MLCAFDFAGRLRELPLSEFFRLTRVGQISLGAFDVLKCFSDVGVSPAAGRHIAGSVARRVGRAAILTLHQKRFMSKTAAPSRPARRPSSRSPSVGLLYTSLLSRNARR